jgi:AcrR family transcriptional regulator
VHRIHADSVAHVRTNLARGSVACAPVATTNTPPTPAFPVRKRSVEDRRVEILETTCLVVIERGFAGTRISDVAKRLEVSSSLVLYHFESKEQLLAEAFSHYARKDLDLLDAEIRAAPDSITALDLFLEDSVPVGSEDLEWMLWIDAWGEALRNPAMRRISQELDARSVEVLEDVIANGVERHELACPDPRASAERITSLIDGLAVQFAAHDGVMTREHMLGHLRVAAANETGITVDRLVDSANGTRNPSTDVRLPASRLIGAETALTRLVHAFDDASNRADLDAWTSCWADDARWSTPDGGEFHGREAIVASDRADRSAPRLIAQMSSGIVHHLASDGLEASGRVTVQRTIRTGGDPPRTVWGIYHDRCVLTPGGWRFLERIWEPLDER